MLAMVNLPRRKNEVHPTYPRAQKKADCISKPLKLAALSGCKQVLLKTTSTILEQVLGYGPRVVLFCNEYPTSLQRVVQAEQGLIFITKVLGRF
jgi:hypothetical protein